MLHADQRARREEARTLAERSSGAPSSEASCRRTTDTDLVHDVVLGALLYLVVFAPQAVATRRDSSERCA